MSTPMAGGHPAHAGHLWPRFLQASEVRVALVAAACLLVEAVLAKNVLDVHLDAFSQLAGMWVWLVYVLVGRRDRVAELATMAAVVLVTVAVLVLYAV
jgi:hypothetical protein